MFNKFLSLFKGKKSLPDDLNYGDEKTILKTGKVEERKELASHPKTHPEVLYYLADDKSADVRRRIAKNAATPIQADEKLVDDKDDEVRKELAVKIARLMPDLAENEHNTLRDNTIKLLERLANDQLPKVRALISEELKLSTKVPKHIITKLAMDMEAIVSAPILEYSPLLNDIDLKEIIAAGASEAALVAIANRSFLSEDVSDEIAISLEIPAVAALLTNRDAQIREDTLDKIIDQAQTVEELHKSLCMRPHLSVRAMKRITGFVASALVHLLMENNDVDESVTDELLDNVRQRIASERIGQKEEDILISQARDFMSRGMLDDNFVVKQIESNRRDLLIACLSLMADMQVETIRKIIFSKSGRAVTALAWKAGLKMLTGYEIQTKLSLVPKAQLVSAKKGKDYPMSEDELIWHLSYFSEE